MTLDELKRWKREVLEHARMLEAIKGNPVSLQKRVDFLTKAIKEMDYEDYEGPWRTCSDCSEDKPLVEEHFRKINGNHLKRCYECEKAYQRRRYRKAKRRSKDKKATNTERTYELEKLAALKRMGYRK